MLGDWFLVVWWLLDDHFYDLYIKALIIIYGYVRCFALKYFVISLFPGLPVSLCLSLNSLWMILSALHRVGGGATFWFQSCRLSFPPPLLEAPSQGAATSNILLQSLDHSLFCRPWKRGTTFTLATSRNHPLDMQHHRAQTRAQEGCKQGCIEQTQAQSTGELQFPKGV